LHTNFFIFLVWMMTNHSCHCQKEWGFWTLQTKKINKTKTKKIQKNRKNPPSPFFNTSCSLTRASSKVKVWSPLIWHEMIFYIVWFQISSLVRSYLQ
jgi:hypothetical protein